MYILKVKGMTCPSCAKSMKKALLSVDEKVEVEVSIKQLTLSGIALLFTLIVGLTAKAHGENKPGPHGGHIRMPGAFHTEVIPRPHGYQIYLLDINFEKPTVKNSHIKVSIQSAGKVDQLKCETLQNHFFCKLNSPSATGTLIIESTRDSMKGIPAEYKIPF